MPKLVDHDERRHAIIAALQRCVSRHGDAGVTLRDVATEAGISIGRVQHYFAGKDDLLVAAAGVEDARMARRIAAALDGLGPGAPARDRVRAIALAVLPLDETRHTSAVLRRAAPPADDLEGLLRAPFADAARCGELPPGAGAGDECRHVAATITGLSDALLSGRLTPDDALGAVHHLVARSFTDAPTGPPVHRSARAADGEELGGTAQRIVRAAERHFADRGIDGASLKDILRDAGQSNAGAVQYYFGDRRGLVRAVIARHRNHESGHRHELLDAYEQAGATDVRGLAEALVTPLAAMLDDPDGGRDYLRINAEYFVNVSRDEQWRNPIPDTSVPRWHQLLDRLADGKAPTRPLQRMVPRLLAVRLALIQLSVLAAADPEPDDPYTVSYLVDVVTSVLATRPSARTEARRAAPGERGASCSPIR